MANPSIQSLHSSGIEGKSVGREEEGAGTNTGGANVGLVVISTRAGLTQLADWVVISMRTGLTTQL